MEETKTNLNSLPDSSDKEFWGDADVHNNLTPQVVFDSKHYFIRKTGHEAQCEHCGWGFALDPGDHVRDGHLYDKENKLVI